MREIKFRAWDKKEKKMKDDFCIDAFGVQQRRHVADEYSKALNKVHEDDDYPGGDWAVLDYTDWYVIENYAIMQYTGLKDKNGKEIYEGDVVRTLERDTGEGVFKLRLSGMEITTHVIFKEGSFVLADHLGNSIGGDTLLAEIGNAWRNWDIEIIGNIYENPDLLKEKE